LGDNHLANQCLSQCHQATASKTLQATAGDEDRQRGGYCANRRTGKEERKRPQQHLAVAIRITQAAVDRRGNGCCQEIACDDPLYIAKSTERARHNRKRRRNDRLVEAPQKLRGHNAEERSLELLAPGGGELVPGRRHDLHVHRPLLVQLLSSCGVIISRA
jgi:hypothetical protein